MIFGICFYLPNRRKHNMFEIYFIEMGKRLFSFVVYEQR